ncbi:Molybdenum cofactor biosynthesis protein MoaD [invertebrate metagenome]|uniref:Molybdenum cofactor biosynthesis protein MoaD n=1 Tax=invertebrate metagenome TaxID=1711999 RepID=A0A484HD13_9ZZZZ
MRILYFAWVKEKIGRAEEEVRIPPGVTDVAGLIRYLRTRTLGHAAAFSDLSVIRAAINQEYVDFNEAIHPTDEAAFFPPVTGG